MLNKFGSFLAAAVAIPAMTMAAVIPETTVDERYIVRRDLIAGHATRYGGDCTEEDCWQNAACAFTDYTLPSTVDGSTCVSDAIWDSSAQCGGCIQVTYKGKTIIVMVTNRTGGDKTHLDMTPATYSKLTGFGLNEGPGGVQGVSWEFVTCPIATTEPLHIHMHGGASKYWPAATVENARRRTKSLEFSDDQGKTWVQTTRASQNFFKAPGQLSSDTAWVKVTSHMDTVVIVKDVSLASNSVTKATKNFA